MRSFYKLLLQSVLGLSMLWVPVRAQQPAEPAADSLPVPSIKPNSVDPNEPVDKRIFGVLPNYRTANETGDYHPLTVKRKFYITWKDSTDYPVYFVAALFSGIAQFDNTHPSFGQGLKGYGRRYGTSFADQTLGNFMTEGALPSLFREDPRYFRRGSGSVSGRLVYAATRIFVTRTDAGGKRFNFSEVVGNAATAGIANAYYPDERSLSDNFQRFATQLGTDAFSQVLKEFWPDLKRKFIKKHDDTQPAGTP
jgi:hypothetical protein